jgi:hypothetical protein
MKKSKTSSALLAPSNPADIKVVDKASFRLWCNAMMLTPLQASSLLRVSTSMIYKYLNNEDSVKINSTVSLACSLISQKDAASRLEWVVKSLAEAKCNSVWPSLIPIRQS